MISVAAKAEKTGPTPWSALKGKIDYFVVDEIQDFTIKNSEFPTIFQIDKMVKFAETSGLFALAMRIKMSDTSSTSHATTISVVSTRTGGSLNNLSAKSINKKTGDETQISLAHDLDNRKQRTSSEFRVFDEMLPHAQQILDKLESLYDGQAKGNHRKNRLWTFGVLLVPTHKEN